MPIVTAITALNPKADWARLLPLLLVCLLLAACSSVSVVEERENAALAPKSAPTKLLAQPFGVSKDAHFDVVAAREESPQAKIGRLIAEGIVSRGERWMSAPGRVLEPGESPPPQGLLVEGRMLMAEQGSRALRLGIGFGAGRTRLETTVRVYNLAASTQKPWLTFKTTGGSNSEPGLLAGLVVPSPVAIPVVVSALGGAAAAGGIVGKGVTQDATRTGRTITAAISEHLAARGLIKKKARAKRNGRLDTPVGEWNLPQFE